MSVTALTGRQKVDYAAGGYLALLDVVERGEIERVRSIVEDLFARRAGADTGDFLDLAGTDEDLENARLPQILMPVKYAKELDRSGLRDAAERVALELLGGPVQYEGEHVIIKPPAGGAETPMHQDEAYWSEATEYDSLSIWFPLQDVSEENGCMRFVPGSHQWGVLPHRSVENDVRKNGLVVIDAPKYRTVPVPLAAGGATVHHCRTIHGSGLNRSRNVRLAYIYGFGLRARKLPEARDFFWQKEKRLLREERARMMGTTLTKMRPEL